MKQGRVVLFLFSLSVVTFFVGSSNLTAADEVTGWTGSHTRVVWVQDHGDGTDSLGHGNNLRLFGYDSEDGKGERQLVAGQSNFFKPLFTPDGKNVVYSNRNKRKMYLLDWQSGKIADLGDGVAVAVWLDPKKKLLRRQTVWVYAFIGPQPENKYGTAQPLYRFPIDDPEDKELVWNSTNMAWSNMQLSRDGELLGGLFPWPHGGVLWNRDKRWQRLGKGCWTSLSPDNSYLFWIFDGLHRNVQVYNVKTGKNWKLNINNAPGIGGFEVYHPRWSNHPRYIAVTGPYEKGEGGNRIGGGGEKVEIYLGRLAENVHKVEDWLQVTHNKRADFYPDVWIDGGGKAALHDTVVEATPAADIAPPWPADKKHLLFVWENMQGENQIPANSGAGFYQSNLELRGAALPTRDLQLETRGGWADSGEAGVRIAKGLRQASALSIEFRLSVQSTGSGDIMVLGNENSPLLAIRQSGGDLLVAGGNGLVRRISGVLKPYAAQHLALLFDGRRLRCYIDGILQKTLAMPLLFAQMNADRLIIGDRNRHWRGILSSIAWYDRLLSDREIALGRSRAEALQAAETDVDRLIVSGRLAESTEIPAPENIGAYSRALVVNVYAVDAIEEGYYSENRILVAEWAILDRKIIKEYAPQPIVERLLLEKFADHPELEGERQMMDVFEPDLEMYYRLPGE